VSPRLQIARHRIGLAHATIEEADGLINDRRGRRALNRRDL
jgi:hypothetical protein